MASPALAGLGRTIGIGRDIAGIGIENIKEKNKAEREKTAADAERQRKANLSQEAKQFYDDLLAQRTKGMGIDALTDKDKEDAYIETLSAFPEAGEASGFKRIGQKEELAKAGAVTTDIGSQTAERQTMLPVNVREGVAKTGLITQQARTEGALREPRVQAIKAETEQTGAQTGKTRAETYADLVLLDPKVKATLAQAGLSEAEMRKTLVDAAYKHEQLPYAKEDIRSQIEFRRKTADAQMLAAGMGGGTKVDPLSTVLSKGAADAKARATGTVNLPVQNQSFALNKLLSDLAISRQAGASKDELLELLDDKDYISRYDNLTPSDVANVKEQIKFTRETEDGGGIKVQTKTVKPGESSPSGTPVSEESKKLIADF